MHALAAQPMVALARAGHAAPHALQCATLDVVSISQPSPGSTLQSPCPALQTNPHVDPPHVAVENAGTGQALPHMPQLPTVLDRSVSQPSPARPLQSSYGATHVYEHADPAQPAVAFARGAHAEQPPQCSGSLAGVTSQPVAGLPSQSRCVASHG